ncbi:MAG: co-chaperone GroES, partial [Candidatus Sulfobium sp.]
MKIRPLHDWVVLEPGEKEESTRGGIIIPEVAKEKPQWGVVVSAGPGVYEKEKGKKKEEEKRYLSTEVKEGDRVLYEKYMAKDFDLEGRKITMVREAHILGVIG